MTPQRPVIGHRFSLKPGGCNSEFLSYSSPYSLLPTGFCLLIAACYSLAANPQGDAGATRVRMLASSETPARDA